MAAVLLKGLPDKTKHRIQQHARKNRRSMNQEMMVLLEEALQRREPLPLPKPLKTKRPINHEWLLRSMKEGRK
jgi:plasmid stability protein